MHARVIVLEAEEQIGFHSSGRSATMLHYALGDRLVRALTLASRPFFDDPPEGFGDVPLGSRCRCSSMLARTSGPRSTRSRPRLSLVREARAARRARRARALPAAEGRRAIRHRRPQRHPPRPARLAAGQSAPAAEPRRGASHRRTRCLDRARRLACGSVTTRERRALLGADPGQRGGRLGRSGRGARRRPADRPRSPSGARSSPSTRRRAPTSRPAVRQDRRRRALFRAGERPPVRLADGRGAERSRRRPARRI